MMRASGWLDARLYDDDVFLLSHILCVMCDDLTETEKEKLKNKFLKDECGMTSKWIPVSEKLPEERGVYLVTQKAIFPGHVFRRIVGYAPNLYDVDEYDFADKKRPGWYEYDSEWGYRELDDVVAWMPLPEPYKAESEVQE